MSEAAEPQSPAVPASSYEAFVRLFVTHEGRLRAFLRTLVPSWNDLDEVMQETSLVAWRKFSEFKQGSEFMAWVAAIGRFEALKARRSKAREKLVFGDDVYEMLAAEGVDEMETLEASRQALEVCLQKLSPPQRELLSAAYQPGVRLHEVASRLGKSVESFYKTIQRLRASLLECIERQTQQGVRP